MTKVYRKIQYYDYLNRIKRRGQDSNNLLKNKAIKEHYIKEATIFSKINYFTVEELKTFLKKNNLKKTGKKEILARRIIENVDEEIINEYFTGQYYELTEKGLNFLESNDHLSYKKLRYLTPIFTSIISIEEYENSLGSLDALKEYMLNVTLKEDASKNDWEEYCSHLFFLSNVHYIDGNDYCSRIIELMKIYLVFINLFAQEIYLRRLNGTLSQIKHIISANSISKECSRKLFAEAYNSVDLSPILIEEESYEFLNKFIEDVPHTQIVEFELMKKLEKNDSSIDFKSSIDYEVLNRNDFKCCICGKTAKEVYLYVGWQRYLVEEGNNNENNLQAFCFDCGMNNNVSYYYGDDEEEYFEEGI